MKVLIVDDHCVIRSGLKLIISTNYDNVKFFEASGEAGAKEYLLKENFDLILTDLNMPDSDPIRLIESIRIHQPNTPIIVLSMNEEGSYALRFFKLGIKAYVCKSSEDAIIVDAIKTVLRGKIFMSEFIKDKLADNFLTGANDNKFDLLSNREFQVARELLTGKSMIEIGEVLGLNPSTVSTYKGKVFEKLDIETGNMVHLVNMAKKYDII